MTRKSIPCPKCKKGNCFANCDRCSKCISESKGAGKVTAKAEATEEQLDFLAKKAHLEQSLTAGHRPWGQDRGMGITT